MSNKFSKWNINLAEVKCPNCGAVQPRVSKPKNLRQVLWGGRTCVCGVELDRHGNIIQKK